METLGNNYVWTGNYQGEKFRANGSDCFAIQPPLVDVDGNLRFSFDKQFILDLNVAVTIEAQRTQSASSSSHQQSVSNTTKSSSQVSQKHLVECFKCLLSYPPLQHYWDAHFLKMCVPVAGACIAACDLCGFPNLPTPAQHPSPKRLMDQSPTKLWET